MKLGSLFQTNIKKTPKYTFAAALNLWSGIILVIFIEIFEICYKTMISCGHKDQEETKPETLQHRDQTGL